MSRRRVGRGLQAGDCHGDRYSNRRANADSLAEDSSTLSITRSFQLLNAGETRMSKWMTGCLIVLIALAGMVWWGYRRMAAFAPGTGPLSVGIKAPPNRVFASLANG